MFCERCGKITLDSRVGRILADREIAIRKINKRNENELKKI